MKIPDGEEYTVIHKSFTVSKVLSECSSNINFNDDFQNSINSGNGENLHPPPDDGDNDNYVFIVIKDSDGNLSEVYESMN